MKLRIFPFVVLLLLNPAVYGATITIQGGQTNQVIEGFGVNANHRSWNNDELKPVLDALIDQAGMTLYRVIYDNSNWEASNDNADSSVFNWDYYNPIYTNAEFTKLWDMMAYLNQRGITNGAILNFMGYGPGWLCGSSDFNYQVLTAGLEDEWAEMVASAVIYARNTRGLQFRSVMPNNEPDTTREGIHLSGAAQYVTTLHKLAQKLDANGLGDVRLIGPDFAYTDTGAMSAMMGDALVMSKLEHFSTHGYSAGGGSAGVLNFIQSSAYPDRTLWQTEFNVWCSTCDNGTRGTYDWSYCRGTAEYLLSHLVNGASAGLVYEGYDSYYAHHGAWGFWGLFAVDNENAAVKTYTPRKNFYTLAQISKWVRPGAQRINISGSTSPFSPLLAFKHTGLGQVTVVGINTSGSAATLNGTLASLPGVSSLNLYYTSTSANLANGGSVAVNNGTFSATIPGDCVFTLTGSSGVKVAITNPVHGASFNAPASIPIGATATSTAGSVALVGFYNGADLLGDDSLAPYQLTWDNVPMGDYALTARAGDSAGNVSTSAVVNVTVVGNLAQVGVSPASAMLAAGGTQQFVAMGADLLGHTLSPQPTFAWFVSGGGTIDGAGRFTASSSSGGAFTVRASIGGIVGTSTITVTGSGPGTIGNTNEGTLTDTLWDNGAWINCSQFQAVSDLTVVAMKAKVGAILGSYKCAIYSDSSGEPSQLLSGSTEVVSPTSGWQTFPLTSPVSLTNGEYYWLAIWSGDVNAEVYYSNTGGTLYWAQYDFGEWPDPIVADSGDDLDYCIYATDSNATNTALPLVMTTTNLPPGSIGMVYTAQLMATGGLTPYSWFLDTNATAAAGLTLSTDGVLSGVPSAAGQFVLPVVVSDALGAVASQALDLLIKPLLLTLGAPPQSAEEIATLGFKLTISANAPGTYLVERTTDFKKWQEVQQVEYTNGEVELTDSEVTGSGMVFYRAVKQ